MMPTPTRQDLQDQARLAVSGNSGSKRYMVFARRLELYNPTNIAENPCNCYYARLSTEQQ